MNKLPFHVDGPAAEIDAVINDGQRRKIDAVDLFRKPHLTWHEYQWCQRLSSKYEQLRFLRLKREGVPVKIFYAVRDVDRSLMPVIVADEVSLKPGSLNRIHFPGDKDDQKPSRLSRLINFLKRATRANYTT